MLVTGVTNPVTNNVGSSPSGTYRGLFSDYFNATQIAREDFERSKELAAFNSQLSRELRQTAYQDTVADLKNAGLNPILAINQGATAAPSVSAPAVRGKTANTYGFMRFLSQIAAGLITSNNALSLAAMKQVSTKTVLPHNGGGYTSYFSYKK